MKAPDNGKNTTCGTAGLACKDCASFTQTCTASFACNLGAVGGGSGGGGGTGGGGGSSGSCNATTCANGCCAANVCIPVGNAQSISNCGKSGMQCAMCPTGNVCNTGACLPSDGGMPSVVGEACTGAADCTSLGTASVCKTTTTVGNGTYEGGYCSRQPCSATNLCPAADSVCTNIPPSFGETSPMCLKKCSVAAMNCRTGYQCIGLQGGGDNGVCYLDDAHFPSYVDAGRPAANVGGACTMDTECQAPPDPPFADLGFCQPALTADGGQTGYTGGYCSADCSDFPEICGANAVCLALSQTAAFCFSTCPAPLAGQSSCRNGYVCQPTFFQDAGFGPNSYCDTSCFVAGSECGAGRYCDAGYCLRPDGGLL